MHHIGKTTLQLRLVGAPSEALDLQQRAQRLWEQEVLPALDAAFSRLVGADELIQVDKVEVTVDGLNPDNWQEELARRITQAVVEAVEKQLGGSMPDAQARRVPKALGQFEAWLFFLENGYLPTTGKVESAAALQQASLEMVAGQRLAQQSLVRLLRRNDHALQRLLWQHSEAFLGSLAEAVTGKSQQNARQFKQEMAALLAKPLEQYAGQKTVQQDKKAAPINPVMVSKSVKNAWLDLREEWSGIFWATHWQAFVLADKVFDSAVFLETVLRQQFDNETLASILGALKTHAQKNTGKFARLLPALEMLEKRLSPAKKEPSKTAPGDPAKPSNSSETQTPDKGQSTVEPVGSAPDKFREQQRLHEGRLEQKQQKAASDAFDKTAVRDTLADGKTAEQASESPRLPDAKEPETSVGAPKDKEAADLKKATKVKESDAPVEGGKPSTKTHWYVPNAGVVLLHPFLPGFFETLGLMTGRAFKNDAAQHKAVYLVHFLATGEFEAPEYDLVFAKHLCGLDPGAVLQNAAVIKKNQRSKVKKEANALLQAAISHWKKLGSTSPDGLRNGFLRRAAKLNYNPAEGWTLQVEQSGIDVLLNSLPWGLSMVKLPWMAEMMTVEWGL